jgi:hypothetical protein
LRKGFEDFRRVRELMDMGCGQLIDQHGLDWWEIFFLLFHGDLESFVLAQHFCATISPADELHVSRPSLFASILRSLRTAPVVAYALPPRARKNGLGHYARVSRKLSASQMIDVFWDKYDPGYQWRGRLTRKRRAARGPAVLLPTAYINVSRTGVSYAETFPEEKFLLVATRRSGWVRSPPQNVESTWLSQYASLGGRRGENKAMRSQWRSLLRELKQVPEFQTIHSLGCLDPLPQWLARGFEVRDAWLNVLQTEPIDAVLCADDTNPYTRIPLLLARSRGLPNLACHHGALDGRNIYKRSYGDFIWAKGAMELDYLVRQCGVPPSRVEIAAPALPRDWRNSAESARPRLPPHILFLSEASDISGGRPEEFYRDILPPLADIALATGRELIVKLHPAESERERAGIVARVLSAERRSTVRIVTGALTEELLTNTWFGITILSTVAMECAVRGIPCFLCKWLECWPFGYVEQFSRFSIGKVLHGPEDITTIPEYLRTYSVSGGVREACWQPASRGRLREIVNSSRQLSAAVAAVSAGT